MQICNYTAKGRKFMKKRMLKMMSMGLTACLLFGTVPTAMLTQAATAETTIHAENKSKESETTEIKKTTESETVKSEKSKEKETGAAGSEKSKGKESEAAESEKSKES